MTTQTPVQDAETTLEMVLTTIALGARDTNFYTFETVDGRPLPPAEPGSHIGLMLPGGLERQYSLISAEEGLTAYTVGVKRDQNGRGGSRLMHDELRVGVRLQVAPPRNNFSLLETSEPVVLFAGGIGITPIRCMIERLRARGAVWSLHYACRAREDAAFLKELEGLGGVHLHFDDEAKAVLPINAIVSKAPTDAHLYCCGPAPMLAAFEAACAGRPSDHVHVEYFTPKYAAATAGGFTVTLLQSGLEFLIPSGKSILHVLQEAGIEVASSCEEGVCGACETRVIAGVPDHRDAILSEQERRENATMMICCSGCKGDRLMLDI